jgi:hypothetical protein
MASENFTTYTEVDPNTDITLTASQCSFDTLLIEADAWVYSDKGVNHFDGDFEHLIDVQATSQAGGYGRANVWSITNSITDFKSCADALGLYFTHLGSDANRRLRLA